MVIPLVAARAGQHPSIVGKRLRPGDCLMMEVAAYTITYEALSFWYQYCLAFRRET